MAKYDHQELVNLPNEILDALPFGISVQAKTQEVLYENKRIKELLGEHKGGYCYSRFDYLADGQKATRCDDCPGYLTFKDGKNHFVIRNTVDREGNRIILKISHYPLVDENENVNKIIELIEDVTDHLKDETIILENFSKWYDMIYIGIACFDGLGNESYIKSDNLPFVDQDQLKTFYFKIGAYWTMAIGQGEYWPSGLYGPLPLLDVEEHVSYTYSFKLRTERRVDDRYDNQILLMLMLMVPFQFDKRLTERVMLTDFIKNYLGQFKSLEQLEEEMKLDDFKKELIKILSSVQAK